MNRLLVLILVVALVPLGALAQDPEKAEGKRAKLDAIAGETLEMLFSEAPQTKEMYKKAYGYAVFSNMKFALGVSGGGGSGVAVNRDSDERTYMKMGTVGVGLGLGGKKYRVVFLFENQQTFDNFVNKGWQADTSASATAGTSGAGVASTFNHGIAIYQFSDKGLMAQAEIAGTKYWKADKLN